MKKLPPTLRWAVWIWAGITLALVIGAGAAFLNATLVADSERLGITIIGGALLVLAAFYTYGSIRLARGAAAGREILTTMGLIGGLPLVLRGAASLTALGLVLVAAVVVLWLPANIRFFRAQKKAARAAQQRLPGRPPQAPHR